MTSHIRAFYTAQELNDFHDSAQGSGYNLIDTEYIEDIWVGIFRDTPGDSRSFNESDLSQLDQREGSSRVWNFDSNPIISQDLVDVEYGGGFYYSTYGSGEGWGSGLSEVSTSNGSYQSFGEDVHDMEANGYGLVDIEYANGQWIGSYNSSVSTEHSPNPASLNTLLALDSSLASEGYGLIDIEYVGENQWVGVFGNFGTSSRNEISTHNTFDSLHTESLGSTQYDIVDIAYGDGVWVGLHNPAI